MSDARAGVARNSRVSARAVGIADIEGASSFFAVLGDPTRLRLVARLASGGPQSISALAGAASVSRQAVTKHLEALEGAGLADSRRTGRRRVFELRTAPFADAHRWLDEISFQWDAAIARLRAAVEE